MFKRIALIGCLLAIVSGTTLRFRSLSTQVYHNDEAWTSLWLSGHSVSEMRADLCGRISSAEKIQRYLRVTPGRGLLASISSVAADDPKHGPIYFGLLRLWVAIVGDSGGAKRVLSVLFGLLALPLAFVLGRDLFDSRFAGVVAAALIAASPTHTLYSQDIRPYSLLVTVTLLSSWVLLRALRLNTRPAWRWYAASVIASLYSHPLFLLVLGSHCAYMALRSQSEGPRDQGRDSRLARFIRAVLFAALAFLPWVVIFLEVRSTTLGLGWLVGRASLRYLAESWVSVWGRAFVDLTEFRSTLRPIPGSAIPIYAGIASLIVLALVQLRRVSGWANLSLALFAIPFLLFIPTDLVLGIQSSTIDRYWLTGLVGAELAVAYALAAAVRSVSSFKRASGVVLLIAILSSGIYSAWRNSETDAWIKGLAREYRELGRIINQAERPLLVCDCGAIVRLLSFSPHLDHDFPVALLRKTDQVSLEGFQEVFLFRNPIGSELDGRFKVVPVPGSEQLWRLSLE